MAAETIEKYTTVAIVLHWLMALLVLVLIGLGWFMVDLPQGPDRSYYFALHKSIGLTVFALLGVRVAWRIRHRPPALPSFMGRWQAAVARTVHLGFYAVLLVQPVTGYVSSSFSGYKTRWFGVPLPHWGWQDAPLNELFTEIHVVVSLALVCLIALHLLGVLLHLVLGERSVLRRILPG
jgi:cytochrome b561